jgi:flagellar hook assembly protein FlgD
MRSSRTFLLLIAATLLLSAATAQARVSHGYSGILSIDTVTAVGDDAAGPPQATTLAAVYPNPFNPRTTIAYELAAAATVKLAIYDLRGMLVRVLEAGPRSVGRHQAIWEGQDDKGRTVPTGTYFCRLSTAQGSQTRKLTLAR